jgi:hypothetical protein
MPPDPGKTLITRAIKRSGDEGSPPPAGQAGRGALGVTPALEQSKYRRSAA